MTRALGGFQEQLRASEGDTFYGGGTYYNIKLICVPTADTAAAHPLPGTQRGTPMSHPPDLPTTYSSRPYMSRVIRLNSMHGSPQSCDSVGT